MRQILISPFEVAQNFIGIKEIAGSLDNPWIIAWLQTDVSWYNTDETPWCSAFINFIMKCLGLPRSYSLSARSWLKVGVSVWEGNGIEPVIGDDFPEIGTDIVILSRGPLPQPGPKVIYATGHVGLFAGWADNGNVLVLAGNQNDEVNITEFSIKRILDIRRIA
jgi:uncharacterized protein (TIGR02594 family)